jgi:hypothetical protein
VARVPHLTLTASNSEGTTQKIIMMETDRNTVEDVIRPGKDIVTRLAHFIFLCCSAALIG